MAEGKVGHSASVRAALERARRHAGAAVVAVLTPVAVGGFVSSAQATAAQSGLTNVSIGGATSTSGAVTTFTYTVANNDAPSGNFYTSKLDEFEIPELAFGDLNVGSFTGPEGWRATLEDQPTQSGTSLKSGAVPGVYILVYTASGTGISAGSSGVFTFTSLENTTAQANFGVRVDGYSGISGQYVAYETGYVDPPVPGGPAAPSSVPEPASMAILGGAVLLAGATRARRKG